MLHRRGTPVCSRIAPWLRKVGRRIRLSMSAWAQTQPDKVPCRTRQAPPTVRVWRAALPPSGTFWLRCARAEKRAGGCAFGRDGDFAPEETVLGWRLIHQRARQPGMLRTRFTEMFGVEHPITQGGMQW